MHVTITNLCPRCEIHFKYDRDVVTVIKALVTSQSWDAARQCLVFESFARTFADVIRQAGHSVIRLEPEAPRARPQAATSWACQMFAALPKRLWELAFTALSRTLHPDIGGDHRAMQRLNNARPDSGSAG